MSQPHDFYTSNADIYGALARAFTPSINAALGEILAAARAGDEPALDLGAGIGTALPALATGRRRLYAVEPSAAMRAGLMAAIAANDELAERTTVLAGTLDQVARLLPRRLGAITALNVIGHLDDEALAGFWELVGERLMPGAPVIIALQGPLDGAALPWTDFGTTRIGDLAYRTEGRAEAAQDGVVTWTMRWTITAAAHPDEDSDDGAGGGGEVLQTREATTSWRIRTPEELAAQAATAGCRPGPARPDLLLYSYIRNR
ncbi:class I SAM-dependent methyltransferase [Actinomyces bowdenii]|uniref:Class I SAM-dependent methyltransferase n=1 Tax=Actinomyces bowdenii TaxID=131109 RepID=A0A853EJP0_9ACTO|nr:class I SAM-dependent methyltransferase [Actinomyces bowdenii]MBF0697400.1 class I SAM-dependent methyltransferase [Actinomyces bowdenii]NYS69573.1 class I SAM-dependent methyltransferase [Actinomyces bowdenii]